MRGFGVSGFDNHLSGIGFRISGFGFGSRFGFRVPSFGFRASVFGFQGSHLVRIAAISRRLVVASIASNAAARCAYGTWFHKR